MESIFSKIVNGELPCYKVAENQEFLAFLDINPNTKGHTICIPKKQIDKIFDLELRDYIEFQRFAYLVAKAIEECVPCKRVGLAVVGLEVPHAHIHLIPINDMKDMTFTSKTKLTEEEFKDTAKKIKKVCDQFFN